MSPPLRQSPCDDFNSNERIRPPGHVFHHRKASSPPELSNTIKACQTDSDSDFVGPDSPVDPLLEDLPAPAFFPWLAKQRGRLDKSNAEQKLVERLEAAGPNTAETTPIVNAEALLSLHPSRYTKKYQETTGQQCDSHEGISLQEIGTTWPTDEASEDVSPRREQVLWPKKYKYMMSGALSVERKASQDGHSPADTGSDDV